MEWDAIKYARKSDEDGLANFLIQQIDMNFWPDLSVDDWKAIVELERNQVGLIVDNVSEVMRFYADEIEKAPAMFASNIDSQYIQGVAKINDKLLNNIKSRQTNHYLFACFLFTY